MVEKGNKSSTPMLKYDGEEKIRVFNESKQGEMPSAFITHKETHYMAYITTAAILDWGS